MMVSALATAVLAGTAASPLTAYDPDKHLDATFYDCTNYDGEYFGDVKNTENVTDFKNAKVGILVWFEFDKNAEKPSFKSINWNHMTSAPTALFNNVEGNAYFTDKNTGEWEIGALSDGHIAEHTRWDRIIFYHKVTDQPVALMSVVQEERDEQSKIVLERAYHLKCDIFDDENAFSLFREFAR